MRRSWQGVRRSLLARLVHKEDYLQICCFCGRRLTAHAHAQISQFQTLGGCLDDSAHCYTLEVSFYSYMTSQGSASCALPYTEEGYMKLGRNLARTFLDYYKLSGDFGSKPSSGIAPKPARYSARDKDRSSSETTRLTTDDRYSRGYSTTSLDSASMKMPSRDSKRP